MYQASEQEEDTEDKCELISSDGTTYMFEKKLLVNVSSTFEAIFQTLVGRDTSSLFIPTMEDDGLYSLHQLIYNGQSHVSLKQAQRIKSQLKSFNINVTSQVSSSFKAAGQCSSPRKEPNNAIACREYNKSNIRGRVLNKVSVDQLIKKHDEFAILRLCRNQANIGQQRKVLQANQSNEPVTEKTNVISPSPSSSSSSIPLSMSPLSINGFKKKTIAKRKKGHRLAIEQAGTCAKMPKKDQQRLPGDQAKLRSENTSNLGREVTQANGETGDIERMTEYIRKNLPDSIHFVDHSGFICFVCGQRLSRSKGWKQHIMGQHFDEYFQCPDCPKRYKVMGSFKRHIKEGHVQSIIS